MPLFLEKGETRTTPFRAGESIAYQIGYIGRMPSERWVRYTRSMKTFRSYYRVTLQYTEDDAHTPYVFELRFDEDHDRLEIRPENPDATARLDDEMREILAAIHRLDIQGDA